jgi:hypothetical protein
MESTIFFEKKVSISSRELNELKRTSLDDIILQKVTAMVEKKCSEDGYILPGSVSVISRSMGYFESARFTGDANYYVKLKCNVLYPVDGAQLVGNVERKNKMGLYVNYKDAIHIQVPRDLHIGNPAYEEVEIGDTILLELKRSRFTINDPFILSSGKFISRESMGPISNPDKPAVQEEVLEEKIIEEEPALSPIPEGNESSSEAAPAVPEVAPVEVAPIEVAPAVPEVAPIEVAPIEAAPAVPEAAPAVPEVAPAPKTSGVKKIGKKVSAANQP